MESPYKSQTTHALGEPADAMDSSPIATSFSFRSHGRCPSSSSILSSPDLPINPSRFALDDLLEDPAEREDVIYDTWSTYQDEPMCICDTTFCEHRRMHSAEPQPRSSFATEWTMGDEKLMEDRFSGERSSKRRRSGDLSDGIASRLSRRFPSISRRFGRHQSSASFSGVTDHGVSHSRSQSVKTTSSSPAVVLPSTNEPYGIGMQTISPASSQESHHSFNSPNVASRCTDTSEPALDADLVDVPELARTPLLPPIMSESHSSYFKVTSPLQLPSVAVPNPTASAKDHYGIPTPPLSAKPSLASIAQTRPGHGLYPTSEIPPLAISEETDPWAIKLGHANFHITPEPYLPPSCNIQSCRRLLDDWESARREYMRQAARIREYYGQTSQTYKLTEEKWEGIDLQWRSYHERANAMAEASGESPLFQPLAETKPLSKIPSLTDPQQPSKFLAVDEADIVGPMVQYAKIQHQHRPSLSKKSGLFKIFTDPSSLLNGRSSWSPRSPRG